MEHVKTNNNYNSLFSKTFIQVIFQSGTSSFPAAAPGGHSQAGVIIIIIGVSRLFSLDEQQAVFFRNAAATTRSVVTARPLQCQKRGPKNSKFSLS